MKKGKKEKQSIKSILKNNTKLVIGLTIGIIVSSTTVYGATILFAANQVSYDNTTSGLTSTNVQTALNELNTKANTVNANYTTCQNSLSACQNKHAVGVSVINGSGNAAKTVNNNTPTTFTITADSGYTSNGATISCTNSQSATISGNTLTTGSISNNTLCTITMASISWHYYSDYNNTNNCTYICPDDCFYDHSTSVWSCVSSKTTAPSSASLTSGRYCWCKY